LFDQRCRRIGSIVGLAAGDIGHATGATAESFSIRGGAPQKNQAIPDSLG
jgi:hypothetical protein